MSLVPVASKVDRRSWRRSLWWHLGLSSELFTPVLSGCDSRQIGNRVPAPAGQAVLEAKSSLSPYLPVLMSHALGQFTYFRGFHLPSIPTESRTQRLPRSPNESQEPVAYGRSNSWQL